MSSFCFGATVNSGPALDFDQLELRSRAQVNFNTGLEVSIEKSKVLKCRQHCRLSIRNLVESDSVFVVILVEFDKHTIRSKSKYRLLVRRADLSKSDKYWIWDEPANTLVCKNVALWAMLIHTSSMFIEEHLHLCPISNRNSTPTGPHRWTDLTCKFNWPIRIRIAQMCIVHAAVCVHCLYLPGSVKSGPIQIKTPTHTTVYVTHMYMKLCVCLSGSVKSRFELKCACILYSTVMLTPACYPMYYSTRCAWQIYWTVNILTTTYGMIGFIIRHRSHHKANNTNEITLIQIRYKNDLKFNRLSTFSEKVIPKWKKDSGINNNFY